MPLDAIVVGAGIVGLSAAIAIARAGHRVTIFERSQFSQEYGAAFQLAPQVIKILKSWEVDVEKMEPQQCLTWRVSDDLLHGALGNTLWTYKAKAAELAVTEPHLSFYRIDVHRILRETALSYANVHLHLSTPVIKVDPSTGECITANGQTHRGDLIIGADGVHSNTVQVIAPSEIQTAGRTFYRFMVRTRDAEDDPMVSGFIKNWDFKTTLTAFVGPRETGKTIVAYACHRGELMNFAIIRPTSDSEPVVPGWNHPVTKDEMDHVLNGFPAPFQRLLNLRLSETIGVFSLMTRPLPPSFVKGKLVVIGDAAHAIHPRFAAGAGTGIEEAGALGTLFDSLVSSKEVEGRLRLFNNIRYDRGSFIKNESETGRFAKVSGAPFDMVKYLYTHDAQGEAREALETATRMG